MTVFRYEIPLSVTLRVPFATRGLVVSRASMDLPLARNGAGDFILPGTLVTGVLRAALARLVRPGRHQAQLTQAQATLAGEIPRLLGRGSDADDRQSQDGWQAANKPHRARLAIRDLVIDRASADKAILDAGDYPRIRLDPELASVAEGFLQFIEQPFAIGETVRFAGVADLRASGLAANRARDLICTALRLVPAIGAIKSSGFGRVVDVTVDDPSPVAAVTVAPVPATKVAHAVTYRIDRPFLVGGAMVTGNLFRGADVVPGGAIKGTIAQALGDAGLASTAMDELLAETTIGHAFPRPADGTRRPWWPMPLSLALNDGHDRVVDGLLAEPAPRADGALRFAVDYKDAGRLERYFELDWKLPRRDVRTRTKIDATTGAAAYEDGSGQLFSYSAVEPLGFEWHGRIVLPDGADPNLVGQIQGLLRAGIVGLGKTGAILRGEIGQPLTQPPVSGDLALTLATPAALNDVKALRDGRPLEEDYSKYWDDLGYDLVRFFALQRLEGGYVALRYPPRAGFAEPYLLTEPGSVFLVRPKPKPKVPPDRLLTLGLPPTEWIEKRDWRSCPFLPENGYGEVRLNLVDHAALAKGVALPALEKAA